MDCVSELRTVSSLLALAISFALFTGVELCRTGAEMFRPEQDDPDVGWPEPEPDRRRSGPASPRSPIGMLSGIWKNEFECVIKTLQIFY